MKKYFKGIRKWIKGLYEKSGVKKQINSYSKMHQFSDPELFADGRHAWFKKNGEMIRRD